ncbi:MAG: acetyl-CoA carboxylase biotin carboxylase subunit [Armatimonadetes bacterium RBG_16_58_9]|nr:MAG: acetyl-CoA carboxylase biotin carboxylase subunit [Armatimonadetes bacterium RBG_16_58_9]
MFKKVLIANRGEIAVRIIRACKEMNVATVAIYSEADRESLHVRMADEAVCVGPPASKDSYLNMPNIISAAMITGAEAIHPGYAYFSEQPSFAEACEACNLKFIGPKASAIELMGDKARAKETVAKAGVPVIPGSKGTIRSEQDAFKTASKMKYPIRLKATAGGGGRGIRVVRGEDELAGALRIAQAEAESAFGNGELYIEKEIEEPRHVEIQILCDEHGGCVHLGERECSIQRRHQKLLEEAPSVAVTAAIRNKMGEAAIKLAKNVGYTNAGTVEFLLDKGGDFYFMEMNTRVQVEHPVTEAVTGVDIVKEQLRIASGEKLDITQKDVKMTGHAIECRIIAEDPDNNFAPSVGTISHLAAPGGIGVRIDTHIYGGYQVPPYYDAMLAKLVVWGSTRDEAINRMSRCLSEFKIEGLKTNIDYQQKILENAYFRKGELSTAFVPKRMNGAV